ncbi:hypothetical protein WCE55_11675 [Luteimonas sp. MJ293]|uniref:tetratricopeptide repeat protein n=1 Tax=Luteimonas sp. MJ146 TaxID=3129240 RepID=UPI0031B9D55E
MSPRNIQLPILLGMSVLLLITAAVYWPGLQGGFIFDDFPNLVNDPDWKVTSLELTQWQRAMSHGFSGLGGRPLAMLSFAGNHYFTGLDPSALKLTNLAIHLLNGGLILLLCRILFSKITNGIRPSAFTALVITAAWMLHPLQVSTVLYVVQRMELGSQTGTLLALVTYLIGRRRQLDGRPGRAWFAASCAATLFGLGFKETALLVPAYAFLFELFILKFKKYGGKRSVAWISFYALSGILASLVFLLLLAPHFIGSSAYETRNFSWSERLLTQLPVLVMYLKQIVLPLPDSLLFYYDQFPVSRSLLFSAPTLSAALALLSLVFVAVVCRRHWPLVPLGISWFFVAHSLTSGVVPLELAFEHRNYLALLGILIAIAQPVTWLCRNRELDARITFATLPVAGLALLCIIQSASWGEPLRLATTLASRNPESARASYELGRLLLLQAGSDTASPQWSLARKEFEHAAQLPNSSPLAEQALIVMDARTGQAVPNETWRSLQSKLSQKAAGPQEINALYALSECRIKELCAFNDQDLFKTFIIALERNPESPALHVMYANFAWNVASDPKLGIEMQREAIRLRPDHIGYKVGLARFLLSNGLDADQREAQSLMELIRAANADGRFDDDLAALESLRSKAY